MTPKDTSFEDEMKETADKIMNETRGTSATRYDAAIMGARWSRTKKLDEVSCLIEALQYYANEGNWGDRQGPDYFEVVIYGPDVNNGGKIAREALQRFSALRGG